MIITQENFEYYAIDYLDGNLDAKLQQKMEAYLEQHPEVKEEMAEMRAIVLLPDEHIQFQHKNELLKPTKNSWLKWWLISMFLLIGIIFSIVIVFYPKSVGTANTLLLEDQEQVYIRLPQKEDIAEKDNVNDNFTKIKEKIITKTTKEDKLNTQPSNLPLETMPKLDTRTQTSNSLPTEEPVEMPQPLEEVKTADKELLDSIKATFEQQQKEKKPIPMASIDSRNISVEKTTDLYSVEIEQSWKNTLTQQGYTLESYSKTIAGKKKKLNKFFELSAPFGKIRLGELKAALLPEAYMASNH